MPTRPPFRNNARLVLLCTVLAGLLLLAVQVLVRKSRDFSPDFLASVLLYGLTVLNIGLLVMLVLVLGRNLVRMVMERLRELDKVAFVRFASVYREFKDVDQFMATLKGLLETRE